MTTAQLAPPPIFRAFDNNGTPLAGGFLYTYAAGTSTPQASYPSSSESTPNTNPVVLNARGECALWLDPTLSYKLNLTDSLGNQIPGYPVDNIVGLSQVLSGFITQTAVGTALWPITPAEIAAGIVPGILPGNIVNFFYAPGVVDRYGTNTTPGTTSMAAAFQAAINQAKRGGPEVTFGDTTTYLIDSGLDLTAQPGNMTNYAISIRGRVNNAAFTQNQPYCPSIILRISGGNAFDCTGNTGINFQNMSITTDVSTFPAICFLLARNTDGRSQIARFDNVQVWGNFADSIIYNFGSENDVHSACVYVNSYVTASGSPAVVRLTAYNVSGITSAFTAIATTHQSTISHLFTGCKFQIMSTSTSTDLIQYDSTADVTFVGCWAYMAGGRAMHFHDGVHNVTNSVSIRDWVTESSSVQAYFADFGDFAGSPSGWRFDNIVSYEATSFLNVEGAGTPTLDEFFLTQVLDGSNKGINIPGTLQNSVIYYEGAITLGTSSGNELHGNPGSWTITFRTADFWYGWTSGDLTWTPGTASVTHGGTLTVSNKSIDYIGRQVTASLALQDSVSMSWAANAAITGLPWPGTVGGGVVAVTNSTTGASIGTGWVSGTSIKLPVLSAGSTNAIYITATYFAS